MVAVPGTPEGVQFLTVFPVNTARVDVTGHTHVDGHSSLPTGLVIQKGNEHEGQVCMKWPLGPALHGQTPGSSPDTLSQHTAPDCIPGSSP